MAQFAKPNDGYRFEFIIFEAGQRSVLVLGVRVYPRCSSLPLITKSPLLAQKMAVRRSVCRLVGLLPFLSLILPVASDCYWPDGSEAYDQHECYGTEGADGLCCAEGDLCLLNHLCQVNGTTATFYRGACSMPGDTNSTCATICTDSSSGGNLSGEQPVGQCSGSSNEFYCSTDKATGSNCTSFASSIQVYTLSGELFCPIIDVRAVD